ncbi:1624_t:CDS:2 [Diversispora eburnea]|uniref:1624_t:CDS:1 n=1 Tax=Diversispora eburnea TaxID=1213867 RepID=A0A9N9BQR3_9GLOM|nr:1624_t:CDS:2 [Diversispora eburnea]
MKSVITLFFTLLFLAITTTTIYADNATQCQNYKDALALQQSFDAINPNAPCPVNNQVACLGSHGGVTLKCSENVWSQQPCNTGLICYALPLEFSRGTSIVCAAAKC